jgi:two-component system, cell cycle sensor histidine kinase and response regulator CckA
MTILTILLVEDDSDLRELLKTALVEWGYNVRTAEDGRRGLAIINNRAETIDMLLLDMVLPFVSGSQISKVLKKQRPTTKCLMMSGYDEPLSDSTTRRLNCRFIAKPFNLRELRVVIGEMLPDAPRV